MELTQQIMQQRDSKGGKGWPVAVKDRIAYAVGKSASFSEAQVAVVFFWTIRDAVLPKLEKQNLAMAANFYTPSGLTGMIRNVLANPYIRYLVLLGNESIDGKDPLTSANAIRAFFKNGLNNDRKLEGFERALHVDKHIPSEMIELVRNSVELIDLNAQFPSASLEEKIEKANTLLKTLPKKPAFLEKPLVFDYEKSADAFPYPGGPLVVCQKTIPETWIEMIHAIYRYGKKNLMDANTDRWVKEVNNMVCVIEDPQNTDLTLNPFLVPLSHEKIRAYQAEILSSVLPPGKAYTYGNKLRAYQHASAKHAREMLDSKEYKDWEFGKGQHLEKNLFFKGDMVEVDQVRDLIDALQRNVYSKSCVAVTWHPVEELMRKHKSSPCLVMLQAMVQDEKLNLTVFFRSHDMVQGWPENAYGCAAIQKEVAEALCLPCGLLTVISGSAQIYNHYYKQVEDMLSKYKKPYTGFHDAMGNYIIKLEDHQIVVQLLHPETNIELERFAGSNAKDVYLQISNAAPVHAGHAMYLGYELHKAEFALQKGLAYEQDRALQF